MRGMIAIGQERVRFSMGRKLVFDIGLAFNLVVRAFTHLHIQPHCFHSHSLQLLNFGFSGEEVFSPLTNLLLRKFDRQKNNLKICQIPKQTKNQANFLQTLNLLSNGC